MSKSFPDEKVRKPLQARQAVHAEVWLKNKVHFRKLNFGLA